MIDRQTTIARELKSFNLLSATTVLIIALCMMFAPSVLAQDEAAPGKDKIRIKASFDTKEHSKAKDTTRSRSEMKSGPSLQPSSVLPRPTIVNLAFPTLVNPGQEVRGTVNFRDPDDYVFSIFITVFYPDGDVVTSTLYDYREEGGDIWKGTIEFWVEIPESETPLPGTIVITCSDEYLNVSQVTKTFIQNY